MNPPTPQNVAQPRGNPEPKEIGKKEVLTNKPVEERSEGAGCTSVWEMLPDEALDVLSEMKHHGSKRGTVRVIESQFLYPDGKGELGDASLRGLDLKARASLVGRALIEYGGEKEAWNTALFRGFVRKLLKTPKPGTEAAAVAKRPEPGRTHTARYVHSEPAEIAKIDATELAKAAGIKIPRPHNGTEAA